MAGKNLGLDPASLIISTAIGRMRDPPEKAISRPRARAGHRHQKTNLPHQHCCGSTLT